jgi:thiamine kinase-like enzyme
LEVERVKVAPKPIFVDRSQGIAVQEVIKGEQSGYKFTHKHEAYLMKLKARDGRRTNIRIEAQKLVKRVSRVKNTNQSLVRNINEFVDMLEENFDLPIVHGHGDFKPWNIIQDKSGSIVAVDWEFSEANQIAGMDIIHYFYEENILKNKKKYLEMIACLKSYLHMLGVDQVAPLLLKRLLAYYVLWHAVVLCENGYDVTDHTLLLGDFNI